MTKDLHPIAPSLSPFQVGETVAFREDHSKHPGLYGHVQAVGVDDKGDLALDLLVFKPDVGLTGKEKTIYRAKIGDLQ